MSKKLNLNLKPGEVDFYECGRLKTIARAKARISQHNASHKQQIKYRVMGGGIEVWGMDITK